MWNEFTGPRKVKTVDPQQTSLQQTGAGGTHNAAKQVSAISLKKPLPSRLKQHPGFSFPRPVGSEEHAEAEVEVQELQSNTENKADQPEDLELLGPEAIVRGPDSSLSSRPQSSTENKFKIRPFKSSGEDTTGNTTPTRTGLAPNSCRPVTTAFKRRTELPEEYWFDVPQSERVQNISASVDDRASAKPLARAFNPYSVSTHQIANRRSRQETFNPSDNPLNQASSLADRKKQKTVFETMRINMDRFQNCEELKDSRSRSVPKAHLQQQQRSAEKPGSDNTLRLPIAHHHSDNHPAQQYIHGEDFHTNWQDIVAKDGMAHLFESSQRRPHAGNMLNHNGKTDSRKPVHRKEAAPSKPPLHPSKDESAPVKAAVQKNNYKVFQLSRVMNEQREEARKISNPPNQLRTGTLNGIYKRVDNRERNKRDTSLILGKNEVKYGREPLRHRPRPGSAGIKSTNESFNFKNARVPNSEKGELRLPANILNIKALKSPSYQP